MPSLHFLLSILLLGFPPFLKSADESFQEFIDRVLQAHNEAGDHNYKLQGITSPQDPHAGISGPPPLPPLPPPLPPLQSSSPPPHSRHGSDLLPPPPRPLLSPSPSPPPLHGGDQPPPAPLPGPLPTPPHVQVLVIVTDHGSGSSTFGEALETHPCLFNLAEPFSPAERIWSKKTVAECRYSDGSNGTDKGAIFEDGILKHADNPKLTFKIEKMLQQRFRSVPLPDFHVDTASLYEGLRCDLAEYFVRIRDLVCAKIPADVCPPSNCTVAFKLFPQYLNGATRGQDVWTDTEDKCLAARNEVGAVDCFGVHLIAPLINEVGAVDCFGVHMIAPLIMKHSRSGKRGLD